MAASAKQSAAKEKARLLTPEFRVSFPHVFKPNSIRGSAPKYSVTMLFPKDADLTPIKEAIKQAKIAKFGSKENWPSDLESPVTDGDAPPKPGKTEREGYAGHWVIKASTNEDQKPGVVDENVQPILEPAKFYPGCYARAYVYAYVWTFADRQGVGFILDHVQKTRDGKSFGGKKPAEQVFQPIAGAGLDDEDADDAMADF